MNIIGIVTLVMIKHSFMQRNFKSKIVTKGTKCTFIGALSDMITLFLILVTYASFIVSVYTIYSLCHSPNNCKTKSNIFLHSYPFPFSFLFLNFKCFAFNYVYSDLLKGRIMDV